MTLRDAMDAFDAALREASLDLDIDLADVEMQLRVWLDEVRTVQTARHRRAEGHCRCGRALGLDGTCRQGCEQ
jgi:hypothetical protein